MTGIDVCLRLIAGESIKEVAKSAGLPYWKLQEALEELRHERHCRTTFQLIARVAQEQDIGSHRVASRVYMREWRRKKKQS